MNGLDLFSGIGGISLGLRHWVKSVAYCEIEPYCQSVLLQRMSEGYLPKAPIWDDIRTLSANELPPIDIITGGFPCQDISVAGRGAGLEGERSGLFFEIMRLAKEIKPSFIFLENVPAITGRGGLRVVREVAALGYDCRWCVISAASVGAMHRRERWFLLAHAKHNGLSSSETGRSVEQSLASRREHEQAQGFGTAERADFLSRDVADTKGTRFQRLGREPLGQEEALAVSSLCSQDRLRNTDSFPSLQADQRAFTYEEEWQSRRGFARFYWPFESRDDWQEAVRRMDKCSDGVSKRLDFIDLDISIMLILSHAKANHTSPDQVLFAVWDSIKASALQNWKVGAKAEIFIEEVLRKLLCVFKQKFELFPNKEEFFSQTSTEIKEKFLRVLRTHQKSSSASHRSRSHQQQSIQYPNSLHDLSQLLAQSLEAAWKEKCRVDAFHHVNSIKALGNAVVPQQVTRAFQILSGQSLELSGFDK